MSPWARGYDARQLFLWAGVRWRALLWRIVVVFLLALPVPPHLPVSEMVRNHSITGWKSSFFYDIMISDQNCCDLTPGSSNFRWKK